MEGSRIVSSGSSNDPNLTTDCVVVGSGPAGGALAAFLSSHGNRVPADE